MKTFYVKHECDIPEKRKIKRKKRIMAAMEEVIIKAMKTHAQNYKMVIQM